ncbi:MAG: tryptophan--tRNA ligase [Planctomycetota bacterium]
MKKRRSLSGIKPTGSPHLGNLLGMILPALKLQATHDCYYFVADYHALTTERDGAALRASTREITAVFLAFGLDVSKSVWYRQSDLQETAELSWILSCFTPMGLLERAHAYKDAVAKGREATHGLFAYPVLMAADILIVESDDVPVGADQKQHVEMTRDIAEKVNRAWGEDCLRIPSPLIETSVETIVGLDGQKMSKSYGNTLAIFEDPTAQRKKVMRITTDSKGVDEPKDPDTCNIFKLYKLIADRTKQEALAGRYRSGGMGYGEAKQALWTELEAFLAGPRERYQDWMKRPDDIEDILKEGAKKARAVSQPLLEKLRSKAGLGS